MHQGKRFKPNNTSPTYKLPLVLIIIGLLCALSFTKSGGVFALLFVALAYFLSHRKRKQTQRQIVAPKATAGIAATAMVISALAIPFGLDASPQVGTPTSTSAITAQSEASKPADVQKTAVSQGIKEVSAAPAKAPSQVVAEAPTRAADSNKANINNVKTETRKTPTELAQQTSVKSEKRKAESNKVTAEAQTKKVEKHEKLQKPADTVKNENTAKPAQPVKIDHAEKASEQENKEPIHIKPASESSEKVKTEVDGAGEVYVTPEGKKYHHRNCATLKKSRKLYATSVESARASGKTPCKVCFH